MAFVPIHSLSLREQVVGQVRTAIIEGRLRPNDHIVEAKLTREMGVSRTPVREALILLEREGLIVAIPNRGSFVRAFNAQDVREIFLMRTTLENFAAELNIDCMTDEDFDHMQRLIDQQREAIDQNDFKRVRSLDMQFHQYLIESSKLSVLVRSWQELVAQIAALLYLRAEVMRHYDEYHAIRDHMRIVEAYRARDLAALQQRNRQINQRVSDECSTAVTELAQQPRTP